MARYNMALLVILLFGCARAAPAADSAAESVVAPQEQDTSDLKTDASTYNRRFSDWSGGYSGNNYGTGYGLLDDKYSTFSGGYGGYDGYNRGYSGYSGQIGGYGGNLGGYGGYSGTGYRGNGYDSGYQSSLGNGGYGGYGGNGGLTSYSGYSNPYYQGYGHLGYGYRKPGIGNIYNSGITPSLVTGYRGYSRR